MRELDLQIDDFMLECETKGLSKRTMSSYEGTIRLLAEYLEKECGIEDAKDVRELHLKSYIKYLQERGKYTVVVNENTKASNRPENRRDYKEKLDDVTINNYVRNIKVFFNYLYFEKIIRTNPVERIKKKKTSRKPKYFIKDSELIKLLSNFTLSLYHEYRDKIITELILDTGMRLGETLLIEVTHVDLSKRCILLPAENTKGKRDRDVFFSKKMALELKRWLQYKDRYVNSKYLFCTKRGEHLEVQYFEKNFSKYTERVGLKEVSPHTLRNNFAKRFLMKGGDIYALSRILGHSSVKVTEEAYLDLEDDDLNEIYQRYSPLANLKSERGI